jgi:Tfp pilus assembly protein PilX
MFMTTICPKYFALYQRGAALIVSMVMLAVITMIGISVMGGSRLELLMSNNNYLQMDALRNAEFALAAGLSSPLSTSAPLQLTPDPSKIDSWNSITTTTANPPWGGTGKYAVEYLGRRAYAIGTYSFVATGSPCTSTATRFCMDTFRVWALGVGSKGAARILQSVHRVSTSTPYISDNRVELPSS